MLHHTKKSPMNTTKLKTVMDDHLAKLVACGNTEALALHLQAQDIKALCGNSQLCALAVSFERAMNEAFPGTDLGVSVGPATVTVFGRGWTSTERFPAWISKFVNNFDEGRYPELMAKNATNWDNDLEVVE
jgi:hypothetical protein